MMERHQDRLGLFPSSIRPSEGHLASQTRFEELVDQLADEMRKDSFDIEEFIAREPSLRQPLQHAFDSLSLIRGLRSEDQPHTIKDLGDFRIITEIGRGGMGVVYEAEQTSLGRRVALKVLPYAAFLSRSRLQRFRQEAQAAAILRHPNIVHVHCVGVERGVHYYAMELIEGQSLAEVIDQLRDSDAAKALGPAAPAATSATLESERSEPLTPSADISTKTIVALSTARSADRHGFYLSVAEIGIQVAQALQYAHGQGIVHRDIKPSNLLLDEGGKPWITDFGLAQTQDDGGLTSTGDLLGTLRYMSPEQAEGRKLVDGRTDIYSLAATLYELVTLKQVVQGDNRQQILSRLEEGRIRQPRSIDPRIPIDLEKVLLKALSADAEDRYESAAALAEDLRRFVEHKPVVARRISRSHKMLRWIARHRIVSALILTTTSLLLAIAIAGPLAALRFQALAGQFQVAAETEEQLRKEAEQQREAAEREREFAEKQRKAAEASNRALIALLSEALDTTVQAIENVPKNEYIKEDLIVNMFNQIERLLAEDPSNEELRFIAGKAYVNLAWAASFRYNSKQAGAWYAKACIVLGKLVEEFPENLEYKYFLAVAHWTIHGEGDQDVHHLHETTRLSRILVDREPDNSDYQESLACALYSWAGHYRDKGNKEAAHEKYRECDEIFEKIVRENPEDIDARCARAWNLLHHAQLLMSSGKNAEAMAKCQLALDSHGDDFSKSVIYTRWRIGHATLLESMAKVSLRLGHLENAERFARKSVQEMTDLVIGFPETEWGRNVYFSSKVTLMDVLEARGGHEEAIAIGRKCVEEWGTADVINGNRYRRSVVEYQLGKLLWWHGDRDEARELLRRAKRDIQDKWLKLEFLFFVPDKSLRDYGTALAWIDENQLKARGYLGIANYRLDQFAEAKAFLLKHLEQFDEPLHKLYLAMTQHQLGEAAEARETHEFSREQASQPRYKFDHELHDVLNEATELLKGR